MTTKLRARFDGRTLVPEEPVELPTDCVLEIAVTPLPSETNPTGKKYKSTLAELADWVRTLPDNPDAPTDGAAQHDHYLYGTPKRPENE